MKEGFVKFRFASMMDWYNKNIPDQNNKNNENLFENNDIVQHYSITHPLTLEKV